MRKKEMYGKQLGYSLRRLAGSAAGLARAAVGLRRAAGAVGGTAALAAMIATGAAPGAAPAAATPARIATKPNTPSQWNHIAAGSYHTCGIHLDNTLWCWGYNTDGELGIGNTVQQNLPRQVTKPERAGWASVTAGGFHSCAIRKDGTLWCWGQNVFGQLGDGATTSESLPQQVTSPAQAGWASVTGGDFHTCAIRAGGTLWCWGMNIEGELGTGNTTDQHLPRQVTTPAPGGWAGVTASAEYTCATRTDGTLWCWGYNGFGELGIGTTTTHDVPQQVTTPARAGWASVATGDNHACATRTDGTLWCWGGDEAGQLGIGSKTSYDLPQQVTTPAPTGWTSVAAGRSHTCARRTGALWCWGFNRYGQLGIGSNTNQSRPQQVLQPSETGWSLLTLGYLHTCAMYTWHTLWCWGYNGSGQLGLGNLTDQNLPQQVTK